MKRLPVCAVLFLLGSLFLSSCGANDPKPVAQSFLTALSTLNFEKAASYCTENGKATLNMLSIFVGQMSDTDKVDFKAAKPKVSRAVVNGETAIVYYTEDGKKEEKSVDMVKVEKKWKVDFKKSL